MYRCKECKVKFKKNAFEVCPVCGTTVETV